MKNQMTPKEIYESETKKQEEYWNEINEIISTSDLTKEEKEKLIKRIHAFVNDEEKLQKVFN